MSEVQEPLYCKRPVPTKQAGQYILSRTLIRESGGLTKI